MTLTDAEKVERKRERMLQKFREYTLTRCKNETARVWQRVVRLEARETDGKVSCVTCDWRGNYKDAHGGHYIPRRHSSTIFHPNNCHVQCAYCNDKLSGNMHVYRVVMRERYGDEAVEELERLKNVTRMFTKDELVDLRMAFMARERELLG